MEKPVYLNQKTYDFILERVGEYSLSDLQELLITLNYDLPEKPTKNTLTEAIFDSPTPFLLKENIFDHPDLLTNTVISLLDGVEFLIDKKAAKDLKLKKEILILETLYKPEKFQFRIGDIIEAFVLGCDFDQLE